MRLKKLRKKVLELSQEEFGKAIGLSKSNISNIELGRVTLTDRNISSICRTFGINEVWLRTGEGGAETMFLQPSGDDEYSLSLGKLSVKENPFLRNMVNYLANAEPEQLQVLEDFMTSCLGSGITAARPAGQSPCQ